MDARYWPCRSVNLRRCAARCLFVTLACLLLPLRCRLRAECRGAAAKSQDVALDQVGLCGGSGDEAEHGESGEASGDGVTRSTERLGSIPLLWQLAAGHLAQ